LDVFFVLNGGVDGTVVVDDCVVPRDVKDVVELTGSGFDDAGKVGLLGTTADVLTFVAGAASDSGVCENVRRENAKTLKATIIPR
jgi:hypothetical protein